MATYVFKSVSVVDKRLPVIDLPDPRPFMTGDGPHDYCCGGCRNVLLQRVEMARPQKVTIVCGRCRGANAMDEMTAL